MRVVASSYAGYFLDGIDIPAFRMKWMDLQGKPYIWHVVEKLIERA
ncbi:hypothetical protein KKB84_02630 [bacterium]|nr:hypothetical protein [bacterium]